MLTYTLRRLLIAIPVFLGITIMAWIISTTNPDGGALTAYLGKGGGRSLTNQQIEAIKHKLGLDQPLPIRYVYWLGSLARGDLGNSIITRRSVVVSIFGKPFLCTGIIGAPCEDYGRIWPTVLLMGLSFLLQEVIAIPLGVFSALRRGSLFDQIFTVIAYVLFALPTFWFGLMAIVIFGVFLHWFPFGGMVDIAKTGAGFGTPPYTQYFQAHTFDALVDLAQHLALPVIVLGTVGFAADSRFMRASMLEVLNQDYIRTARAKGLSRSVVTWKHALRNGIMPIVTNIGLAIPVLLGGAVVTEQIYSWPGMGRFFIQAAQGFDYPVVIAFTILIGGLTLIFNILTDLSYALVDPRIRYS